MSTLIRHTRSNMKYIHVYKGVGANDDDTDILARVLKRHADTNMYKIECITPQEIINGKLCSKTALLAIGGGYDLGLINSLGTAGMRNIRSYVQSGGSYLGICSGAYFACDRIEFDKDGPLEVVGDRFLKFFPGSGHGPLFKPYDYSSRKGASAVDVDFIDPSSRKFQCKTYFNGGCYFKNEEEDNSMSNTIVLSRYLSLPESPAAIVQCKIGSGTAVLSGPHFEFNTEDIDDGDADVVDIIPYLKESAFLRRKMMKSVLNILHVVTNNW